MTDQTQRPLSLDLASFAVFALPGAGPVAILNEDSSLLGRLQYCQGVVGNLELMASVCTCHEDIDVQNLAAVFNNQLDPLSTMLARLVSDAESEVR